MRGCLSISNLSFACFDCGILALESFRHLGVKVEDALICKYRWLTEREIKRDIERRFGNVFIIPYDQRIVRAQIMGKTMASAYSGGRAYSAYRKLSEWLLKQT